MWQKRKNLLYLLIASLLILGLIGGCSSVKTPPASSTATQEITISLPDSVVGTILVTDQGKALKNAQVTSSDGFISIFVNQGTVLLDDNNRPLQRISAVIDAAIPLPPENAQIIGNVVDIQPQEVVIYPSLKITLKYDPLILPQGANEDDLSIYNYNGNSWEITHYRNIDAEANQVTTIIDRFGKYSILLAAEPVETTPAEQPGLVSTNLFGVLHNGKPTFAEFGSSTCAPCKYMRGIIEQLALDYKDRTNVVIIEVYEQRDVASLYRIMTMPTQIIFDSNGVEIKRHIGVWEREQIDTALIDAGIP